MFCPPFVLERAMGIEPTSEAWEASILPLYDARSADWTFRLYTIRQKLAPRPGNSTHLAFP